MAWQPKGNIKGPPGIAGPPGAQGPQGPGGATGPQGIAGEQWFTGSGVPGSGVGAINDWYLNSANGDFYEKTSGTVWTLRGNLKGATGAQGPQGTQGTQGPTGNTGATGPAGSTGPQGPQGPIGATGSQGAAGVGVPAGGGIGAMLRKNTATNYDTEWAMPNIQDGKPADPVSVAVVGSTPVMAGLAQTFTARISGAVLVLVQGRYGTAAANSYVQSQIRVGTGTPPAKGAAVPVSNAIGVPGLTSNTNLASTIEAVSLQAIFQGMGAGQYWFDVAVNCGASQTVYLYGFDVIIIEL